ncbi:nucleotidyltransferase domain-containing protein [Nocardia carnea]|uniref:nucleotidyltransferase domain-containing protein n=1 Tax=Nocardia carnea TaxID=37328 RepID=UPI002453EE48|nr:nucleotidyltransferase domain-containing protein [Nocardia carnea]
MSIDGFDIARSLVRERFPGARAAWLGGSTVLGTATSTSDLDISVLLDGPPAPYRESLRYQGWPVELFVHTEDTMQHFLEKDRTARRPATLRLIGSSLVLLDIDGSGEYLREECAAQLAAGPDPLTADELRSARYGITDRLDDLMGCADDDERLLVATDLWRATADLLLTGCGHWTGTGKWLQRELTAFDRQAGTEYAKVLAHAVRSVARGDMEPIIGTVTQVLNIFGGRLFDGFTAQGPT